MDIMPLTRTELKALVPRPRLKWGQHFLCDTNMLRWMAERAEVGTEDTVLEVGAGPGNLTEVLAERAGRVLVSEIDRDLISIFRERLAGFSNWELLEGDCLDGKRGLSPALAERLSPLSSFKLVANLPYEVASPLAILLAESFPAMTRGLMMVQMEVGKRMVAAPGSRDYGLLGILLQLQGRVKIVKSVVRQLFWPVPGVDSVMVLFEREPGKRERIDDYAALKELLALGFNHRRKALLPLLKKKSGVAPEILEIVWARQGWDEMFRAESISPEGWVALVNAVAG